MWEQRAARCADVVDQLEVPGIGTLLLANRTVELDSIMFDTSNGGSVPLSPARSRDGLDDLEAIRRDPADRPADLRAR